MAEPYRVDMLTRASKAFDAALAQLPLERRLPVLAATAKALQRLRVAPFEFGEELYDLNRSAFKFVSALYCRSSSITAPMRRTASSSFTPSQS